MDRSEPDLDPRRHAVRPDLADVRLRGRVTADRYVEGELWHVAAPVLALRRAPQADAMLVTQALRGEHVLVFEEKDGWAWLQLEHDHYVGYAALGGLRRGPSLASHKITAPRTLAFSKPNIKSLPCTEYYSGCQVTIAAVDGDLAELSDGTFVPASHVGPLSHRVVDPVDMAAQFVGVPYLWGGKTHAGLDCSGLVQTSLLAAGIPCPRDSDMQEHEVGVLPGDPLDLRRGDLIFWPGHVGMMLDGTRLLHANAHHMACVSEPLEETARRLTASGIEITGVRRPVVPEPAPASEDEDVSLSFS